MSSITHLDLVRLAGIEPYGSEAELGASLRYAPGLHQRLARLGRVNRALLSMDPDVPGALAHSLLSMEAIGLLDLDAAIKGLPQAVRLGDHTVLDWRRPLLGSPDRRMLGHRTVACLVVRGLDIDPATEVSALEQLLHPEYVANKSALAQFSADLLLYFTQILPMPLWAHVSGLQVMTPLRRDALARGIVRRIIRTSESTDLDLNGGVHLSLLDESENEARQALQASPQVDRALALLKQEPGLDDAAQRLRWRSKLEGWISTKPALHPADAVVIAWIAYLVEFGTVTKSDARSRTVQDYARSVAPTLAAELHGLPKTVHHLEAQEFRALYAAVSQALPGTARSRPSERAALMSFHQFLVEQIDAPSDVSVGGLMQTTPRVLADVVWPHELERAIDFCRGSVADVLLGRMADAALQIAGSMPIRTGELMRLRIEDVRLLRRGMQQVCEVHVVPMRGRRELKTPAAARWGVLADPKAVAVVAAYVEDRRACGYGLRDYLFGAPTNPGTRYQSRRLVDLMLRALKRATGRPDTRVHDLRHAVISSRAEGLLGSSWLQGPDRWVQLSVDAGHAHPATTLINYCHLYELPLRARLDAAYAVPPPQPLLAVPDLIEALNWTDPTPPAAVLPSRRATTFDEVLLYLSVKYAVDLPSTAKRLGLESADVGVVNDCLSQWLRLRFASGHGAVRDRRPDQPDALAELGLDIQRVHQPKYQSLVRLCRSWSGDQARVRQLIDDWPHLWRSEYVRLDDPARARSLWLVLAQAEINPELIQVCCPRDPDPQTLQQIRILGEDFHQAFGSAVTFVPLSPRRGRPSLYLRWLGEPPVKSGAAQGSGTSVEGLIALMAVMLVWAQLRDGQSAPEMRND